MPSRRILEAYEKARALELEVGSYGAKLDQDKILTQVEEIRKLLEFLDGEETA